MVVLLVDNSVWMEFDNGGHCAFVEVTMLTSLINYNIFWPSLKTEREFCDHLTISTHCPKYSELSSHVSQS